MANFARIVGSVAVDVSTDPNNEFHPDLAAQFVAVPDVVEAGWSNSSGAWLPPEPLPVEPEVSPKPKVSPIEFKLLFTSQERVAIRAARQTDPIVDDFFSIVDDPRLTYVDLNLPSTQAALRYFETLGVLAAERIPQILSGEFQ